jgi:hypothetical protein
MRRRSARLEVAPFVLMLLSLLAFSAGAQAQAVIGTAEGSNQIIDFPSPSSGLPSPVQIPVTGLPVGFHQPFAVSFFGPDDCLVSDFGAGRIFVVRVSSHQVVSTIPTLAFYDGTGSLAVAPGGSVALASGGTNQVTVITAPFGPASQITTVPMPGAVAQQTTQAIVFDPAGRAFVYQQTGLSVLDPPYAAVNFTIPISTLNPGRVAITPDGKQVLATTDGGPLLVFTAPFSPASVPAPINIPPQQGGIVVVTDGSKVLVSLSNAARLFAVSAPYNASSTVEEISLTPPVFAPSADIGISADGQLAVLAGQGGFTTPDVAFVRAPFTAAGASVLDVKIPGGRGNGAVRFAPAGSVVAVPALSWPMKLLALLGISLAALFRLQNSR